MLIGEMFRKISSLHGIFRKISHTEYWNIMERFEYRVVSLERVSRVHTGSKQDMEASGDMQRPEIYRFYNI